MIVDRRKEWLRGQPLFLNANGDSRSVAHQIIDWNRWMECNPDSKKTGAKEKSTALDFSTEIQQARRLKFEKKLSLSKQARTTKIWVKFFFHLPFTSNLYILNKFT